MKKERKKVLFPSQTGEKKNLSNFVFGWILKLLLLQLWGAFWGGFVFVRELLWGSMERVVMDSFLFLFYIFSHISKEVLIFLSFYIYQRNMFFYILSQIFKEIFSVYILSRIYKEVFYLQILLKISKTKVICISSHGI